MTTFLSKRCRLCAGPTDCFESAAHSEASVDAIFAAVCRDIFGGVHGRIEGSFSSVSW